MFSLVADMDNMVITETGRDKDTSGLFKENIDTKFYRQKMRRERARERNRIPINHEHISFSFQIKPLGKWEMLIGRAECMTVLSKATPHWTQQALDATIRGRALIKISIVSLSHSLSLSICLLPWGSSRLRLCVSI